MMSWLTDALGLKHVANVFHCHINNFSEQHLCKVVIFDFCNDGKDCATSDRVRQGSLFYGRERVILYRIYYLRLTRSRKSTGKQSYAI